MAIHDTRLADAHQRIVEHLHLLHSAVTPRQVYGLVHGELRPDHVLLTSRGEAALIDIEGTAYFDVEWSTRGSR